MSTLDSRKGVRRGSGHMKSIVGSTETKDIALKIQENIRKNFRRTKKKPLLWLRTAQGKKTFDEKHQNVQMAQEGLTVQQVKGKTH